MINKVEQVSELIERLESIALAGSFQLFVVDQNIMIRKMIDSGMPHPPYEMPTYVMQFHELLTAVKLAQNKPIVIWDMEFLPIEENVDQLLRSLNEREGLLFLASHTLDKARLVPILQKGIAGFMLKPYTVDTFLLKVKEKLFK